MVKLLITLSLFGGAIGLLGILFSPNLGILGLIGLSCLCAILARIAQATEHTEAINTRLEALYQAAIGHHR
jgi:hypothetical protein